MAQASVLAVSSPRFNTSIKNRLVVSNLETSFSAVSLPFVMTPDACLALDGENIVIQKGKEELRRIPLHNLDGIVAFGFTGASPALMWKVL